MQQKSLAVSGFEKYRKQTRKEIFLEEMNQIIPWQELSEVIAPHDLKPQRYPVGIKRMLGIDCLQHGFALSDPVTEAVLYDIPAMRVFAQIDRSGTRARCNHPLSMPSSAGKEQAGSCPV